VDGLTWLRARGQAIGRPVVANLSLGGQAGPHDGSRLYERAIDNLSGPGFIVVISSGNNGVNRNTTPVVEGNLIHARGFATGTTTTEFTVEIPAYTPSTNRCNGNFVTFSFWYEGADRLRLEVVRPSGTSASAVTGATTTNNDNTGQILIDNGSGGVSPENGDYEAVITISGCGTSGVPEPGTWRIRVTPTQPGTGLPFDMWMVQQVMGLTGIVIGRTGFDNRFVVGSPGNATRAVTVGAFVTKLCWRSPAAPNQVCYTQREQVGDIARFSSAGPRRDGVQKPEITAPGLGITSALSRAATVPSQRVVPDSVHWTLEGTSMAAPHVTGSIAVLMQVRPMLTPEEAKGILAGTAAKDSFTTRTYGVAPGGRPMDWWGAGKLNVRDALLSLSDNTPAVLAVSSQSVAPSDETVGAKGTLLPLLKVQLEAKGFEAIDVLNLSFQVTGRDPSAKVVLVRDLDADGNLESTDRVLGSVAVALNGTPVRVDIRPDSLRIPPFARTDVYLAVQLSGDAPNGAAFSAEFLPAATQSVGTQSHAQNNLEATTPQTPSAVASTTILAEGQLLSFSENPVRHAQVIFNFAETPSTASVYTVQGRRVADLCARMASGCAANGGGGGSRLEWDLTNDDGARVAPSVYLVIFSVSGQIFREKLIVMTPGGSMPDIQE
jgi:subtilisin family serine protease